MIIGAHRQRRDVTTLSVGARARLRQTMTFDYGTQKFLLGHSACQHYVYKFIKAISDVLNIARRMKQKQETALRRHQNSARFSPSSDRTGLRDDKKIRTRFAF